MWNKIKKYIKNNWIIGLFKLAQLFLVGQISFFLLKELIQVDFVESILDDNEKYYLSAYNGIQFVVTYILFIGIGFLIEEYLNRWIRKNEAEISINLKREDKKGISTIIHFVFSVLVFFKFLSIEELDQLDELNDSPEEHERKWKKTIAIWKNSIGLLVLGLTTAIISWDATTLFIILGIVLAVLIAISVVVLIMYYVLLKNLHLINVFIKGYNTSARLLKKGAENGKKLS